MKTNFYDVRAYAIEIDTEIDQSGVTRGSAISPQPEAKPQLFSLVKRDVLFQCTTTPKHSLIIFQWRIPDEYDELNMPIVVYRDISYAIAAR